MESDWGSTEQRLGPLRDPPAGAPHHALPQASQLPAAAGCSGCDFGSDDPEMKLVSCQLDVMIQG